MSNSKLQMRDAELIRVFSEFGFSSRQLAAEYGVHADTIRNVLHFKSFNPSAVHPYRQNKRRKLNDDQVRLIRRLKNDGLGEQAIAKKLGGTVHRSTVRQVMHGVTYQDIL